MDKISFGYVHVQCTCIHMWDGRFTPHNITCTSLSMLSVLYGVNKSSLIMWFLVVFLDGGGGRGGGHGSGGGGGSGAGVAVAGT